MQVGFSKMLPQIAMGQSQSSILANAYFENDLLDLVNLFVPPLMSSTMNADSIALAIETIEEDKNFKMSLKSSKNFYGDGFSGKKIADYIKSVEINAKLFAKKMMY